MTILLAICLWAAPLVHRAPGPVRHREPLPRLPVCWRPGRGWDR